MTSKIRDIWQCKERLGRLLYFLVRLSFDFLIIKIKYFIYPKHTFNYFDNVNHAHILNADRLYYLLEKNSGTWIKAGQFLSARPDLLPPQYIEALTPLQNNSYPMNFTFMQQSLATDFGPNWSEHFRSFDTNPIASASIGQVYKAYLKDGTAVAVKVLIPGIDSKFSFDFIIYRWASVLLQRFFPHIDFVQSTNTFLTSMQGELDYTQEARNTAYFFKLEHIPGIKSPEIIEELCSANTITTKWIEGNTLTTYLEHANEMTIKEVLTRLQSSFLQQVLRLGCFQGDPHPGNFIIDNRNNIYRGFWLHGETGYLTAKGLSTNYSCGR